MQALLVLEDGSTYRGELCGAPGEAYGQLVLNEGSTGFQEVLTNPGYHGKLPVFTCPVIGNCGYNMLDMQSSSVQVMGLIAGDLCNSPSNWRCLGSLNTFLNENRITGITEIDTRALSLHLRAYGSQYAIISTVNDNVQLLCKRAQKVATIFADRVTEVTSREILHLPDERLRFAVLDLGISANFLQMLRGLHFDLFIFPAHADVQEILDCNPFAAIVCGGPGGPDDIPYVVGTARALIGRMPILGIGLGLLVMGVALGGQSGRMHLGHYGNNFPVLDSRRNRAINTQQQHDHILWRSPPDAELTHINLQDGTIEGFRMDSERIFCVQYHPNTSDGPMDSRYILREFIDSVLGGAF